MESRSDNRSKNDSQKEIEILMTADIKEQFLELQENYSRLEQRITIMDRKLDQLIQSNRSLIDWFRDTNSRNVRELNQNLRGFNKGYPPAAFVPVRTKNF